MAATMRQSWPKTKFCGHLVATFMNIFPWIKKLPKNFCPTTPPPNFGIIGLKMAALLRSKFFHKTPNKSKMADKIKKRILEPPLRFLMRTCLQNFSEIKHAVFTQSGFWYVEDSRDIAKKQNFSKKVQVQKKFFWKNYKSIRQFSGGRSSLIIRDRA